MRVSRLSLQTRNRLFGGGLLMIGLSTVLGVLDPAPASPELPRLHAEMTGEARSAHAREIGQCDRETSRA